jgi:hypothetical protein
VREGTRAVKPPALAYELRKTRLVGSLSIVHTILVDGVVAHEQLSPYSEEEVEERVRAFLRPEPFAPVQPRKVTQGRAKPGPKQRTVTAQGFKWEEPSE